MFGNMRNTFDRLSRLSISIPRDKLLSWQAEAAPIASTSVQPLPRVIDAQYFENATTQVQTHERCLLWPIVGLPVEVMILIFEYACGYYDPLVSSFEEHKNTVRIDLSRLRMPFTIASTTSSWRTLSLNTPSLWTYIGLPAVDYFELMPTELYEAALARMSRIWHHLLSTQLERSGSAPIDVRIPCFHFCLIGGPEGPSTAASAVHTQALIALAPHVARIRSLWIAPAMHPLRFWQLFAYEVRQAGWKEGGAATLVMPGLEALVIENGTADFANAIAPRDIRLDIHLDAPRLGAAMLQHSFALLLSPTGPGAQIGLARKPLALLELTLWDDIDIGTHLYPLLKECSETLQTLSINLYGAHGSNRFNPSTQLHSTPDQAIFLPYLHEFSLGSQRHPNIIRDLLRLLDTPTLRRAVLIDSTAFCLYDVDQIRSPIDALLEFIHPGVEELDISVSRDVVFEAWTLDIYHARTIKERFTSLGVLRVKDQSLIDHGFLAALGIRAPEETPTETTKFKTLVLESIKMTLGTSDIEYGTQNEDIPKLLEQLKVENHSDEARMSSSRNSRIPAQHVYSGILHWG